MNEWFADSTYFGVVLSLSAYAIGMRCKKKWDIPLLSPLLVAMTLIIVFLLAADIPFETYSRGAQYITVFLTPATVCFAVPLYRQMRVLRENAAAVAAGILCGALAHAAVIVGLGLLFGLPRVLELSLLPKSVTTAIALGISDELGGTAAITVAGVTVAGMSGNVLGPTLLRLLRIREPEAQGLSLGCASHAMGTSKAVELGEIQGAMSSLAIVVTGILTVIVAPWIASYLI